MAEQTHNEDLEKRKKVIATTIASPIATIIAKFACHPIDTIKSKIQARASKLHNLSEYEMGHSIELGITLFIVVKKTFAQEGIKGFFPGVTLSAFGSIIAFSAYMTAYEKTKVKLEENSV